MQDTRWSSHSLSALQPYARQRMEQLSQVIAPMAAADYIYELLTPFRIFLSMVDLSSFAGLARMEKAETTLTVFRPILLLFLIMPLKPYPTMAGFD